MTARRLWLGRRQVERFDHLRAGRWFNEVDRGGRADDGDHLVDEGLDVAVQVGDSRGDVVDSPDACPVEGPSRVIGQLAEKGTLGPAVSFSEGVDGVNLAQVVTGTPGQVVLVESPEAVLAGKIGKHPVGIGGDVLRKAEDAGLADDDRANVTCPRVDVCRATSWMDLPASPTMIRSRLHSREERRRRGSCQGGAPAAQR